jgi:hypothetical protein
MKTLTAIPITETEFQRQVTDLAEILGWQWVHFRPAQTSRGWRTPVSGPLGKGWPDLLLVRHGRFVFAELKAGKGRTTLDQETVMHVLAVGAECHVWRPADFDAIAETLR